MRSLRNTTGIFFHCLLRVSWEDQKLLFKTPQAAERLHSSGSGYWLSDELDKLVGAMYP